MNSSGAKHGLGTLQYAGSDHFYTGQWVQNVKQGSGLEVSAQGRYAGDFVEGKRHGHGTMTYSNGSVHCGLWENGLKDGEGYTTCDDSDYLGDSKGGFAQGMFNKGKFSHGKYTWPNGEEYIGDYVDGMEGHGEMTFLDGSIYTGPFKNGQMHGKGSMKPKRGRAVDDGGGRRTGGMGRIWGAGSVDNNFS
eukprot:gene34343-42356_t